MIISMQQCYTLCSLLCSLLRIGITYSIYCSGTANRRMTKDLLCTHISALEEENCSLQHDLASAHTHVAKVVPEREVLYSNPDMVVFNTDANLYNCRGCLELRCASCKAYIRYKTTWTNYRKRLHSSWGYDLTSTYRILHTGIWFWAPAILIYWNVYTELGAPCRSVQLRMQRRTIQHWWSFISMNKFLSISQLHSFISQVWHSPLIVVRRAERYFDAAYVRLNSVYNVQNVKTNVQMWRQCSKCEDLLKCQWHFNKHFAKM